MWGVLRLSTAVLKATDGGVTFGGIVPASSAHGGLAGSSVGAFLPDFSSGLFFRASLLGLLCLVRVNCRKLYRMVL